MSIVQAVLVGLTLILYVFTAYGLLLALGGLKPSRRLPHARYRRRFAVLIPAHNEARVVPHLLESLKQQNYPPECFEVVVLADNCTDATAQVARDHGARVLERFNQAQKGKAWNLRWALSQIRLSDYDAVAFFDADNLAHPDFLARMNDYLEAHPQAQAVQGYLEIKNPEDTWVTRSYALTYWFSNHFAQLARNHWGLSAQLGGTGCVLQSELLQQIGWPMQSLTEDLEFTAWLVMQGQMVHWNPYAVVYDEKPLTLSASLAQRTRWMQGHFWVFTRYAPEAGKAFFRTLRWQYLDLMVTLASPLLMATGFLAIVMGFVSAYMAPMPEELAEALAPVGVGLGIAQGLLQLVVAPTLRFGRFNPMYVVMLVPLHLFNLSWFIPVFKGIAQSNNQGNWVKTEHTRTVRLDELTGD